MIATGIKDHLVAQGVGTFGTDLFVSQMPDTPDNVMCVFDEAGPVLPEMSSYDADNFGTMIMVRGSYSFVKAKMIAIHRAVTSLAGTFDSIRIIDTHIQSEPKYIETDNKGRRVYTVHYTHYCNLGNNLNRTGTYNP